MSEVGTGFALSWNEARARKVVTRIDSLRYSVWKRNTTRAHLGPLDTLEDEAMTVGTHAAGPQEIGVTVTVDQIKGAHYLLGRFNKDTGELTDINVLADKNNVPPATGHMQYRLIGGGMGTQLEGVALDFLIGEKCAAWDGETPVKLFFNRANGGYIRWAPVETGLGKTA